ncbi:hypothetical protein FHW96_002843 [Novosphingobium sp. SG751A]|uniref:hypothetical protein n=1 Tax=Novosphingobium sp. SG751A TaxID=2587000 RepID=UPI001558174C|nr:hypothetical protein [Novosphingobium sp. SG751A]NOW46683.1 hypothetical protein [Novosphingobium sp. SG751A]
MTEPDWVCDQQAAGGMGNTVLYRMVRDYPDHKDPAIVQDKMLIIGRVYSAAVTRGGGSKGEDSASEADGLYQHLARAVVEQGVELDRMIEQCRNIGRVSFRNLSQIIETHRFLNDLIVSSIKQWRGRTADGTRKVHGRTSFVSKYLHFHAPMAFFIYDSIVNDTLKLLMGRNSRIEWSEDFGDDLRNTYARHCYHMLRCTQNYYSGVKWNPRLIDGHLMGYINGSETPEEISKARNDLRLKWREQEKARLRKERQGNPINETGEVAHVFA